MKVVALVFLCAGLSCSQAAQLKQAVSPVTRVVKLLQGLAKQVEADGKKEEDLYETFVCWGKSVIAQKKESNSAANARIDALNTYISDLDSGKVELTSERQELEKEIEELTADLDTAKALREKENKDFEDASTEMKQAISALTSAIKVLNEATKDNKKGALLAYHAQLNGGVAALEAESKDLNAAVALGERFLTKADSVFLRRLLTGDVPERDEKMLRRSADFKKSYKTRSGNIQDVLKKLKFTFENNLKSAEEKEREAKEAYDKLSEAKGDLLKKAQDAKATMAVENGARGQSKAEAEEERDALKSNVENDLKFIKQTEDDLEKKKGEWEERSKLFDGELQAISKAIDILYNDDARDLFKKSFDSQEGLFFLQRASTGTRAVARVIDELKAVARKTGDRRIALLADLADPTAVDHKAFKPVLDAIDKMLETLKKDEKKDLETKEDCEKGRMDETRKALLAGQDIDEKTEAIRKLDGEIADLKASIKKLLEQKQQVQDELDKADRIRQDENAAWQKTDSDDDLAAITVADATKVLKDFYSNTFDQKFNLLQKRKQSAVPVVEGEAPPPPPATWEAPYGGKQGESSGIVALLEMVHEDIKKDQEKAKAEEDQSQEDFDKFKEDSEKEMKDLQSQADEQDGIKGDKEGERSDTIKERRTKKEEWDATMKSMKDTAPNCEYYAVNYKLRRSNRQIEIDGLNNAKAILSGGSFK